MGKGSKQKDDKKVFKVAGARSLKAKNKAKTVSTQLKKQADLTKKKTMQVDTLLGELEGTLRQVAPRQIEKEHESAREDKLAKIQIFNKTQESSTEALRKLNQMKV